MKKVKVACDSGHTIGIEELSEFQGNLKSLSEVAYKKLKLRILKNDFSFAVHVWKNKGQNHILDGHQRVRTLMTMKQEGYEIPKIPIVIVTARSFEEAKEKCLGAASQFGKIERDGLREFMDDANMTMEALHEFEMPEINLEKFEAEYFEGGALSPEAIEELKNQVNQDKFIECPECGHKFKENK